MKNYVLLLSIFLVSMTFSDARNKEAASEWDRYGVLCITNNLDFTMSYSYRWGNGDWCSISIYSGGTQRHWYEYPDHHTSSPDFTIHFDHDPTSGVHNTPNSLIRYRSPDTSCDSAKKYVFEIDVDDNEIKLYSKN